MMSESVKRGSLLMSAPVISAGGHSCCAECWRAVPAANHAAPHRAAADRLPGLGTRRRRCAHPCGQQHWRDSRGSARSAVAAGAADQRRGTHACHSAASAQRRHVSMLMLSSRDKPDATCDEMTNTSGPLLTAILWPGVAQEGRQRQQS